MSDVEWQGARPDPGQVQTAAEFLDLLRLLRVAAGNPSLGVLSRRTKIPRTTLHDALNVKCSTMPPLELVTRLASACGCPPVEVAEWAKAWRAVCQPNSAMASPAHLVPRQLPAPPRLFTGREEHLADLSASGVTVISGVGGIGKTWLALRWAHDNLSLFPDGQLYVDLRGFDLAGDPMPVAVAVRSFLDALGVEAAAIPADLDAQVGLYRSVIAKRRMLIVLDNARDTAQVAQMLPGSPLSTVLVTSRRMLTGMMTAHGALPVGLEVLCDTEARDLLARHLGPDRLVAEPEATAAILTLCGGLPLALSTIAALAAAHPHFSLDVLAGELAEARLDALDTADLPASIRAVFGSSYRVLEPAAAEVFGLLGLTGGPDISLAAASALAGRPARKALKELHLAHLAEEYQPGRYRMHDLVRLYAAEQACAAGEQALVRLVDFYLQSALSGASILDKDRPPIEASPPVPGYDPVTFTDRAEVLAWFDAERFNLLAAQRIAADHSWHSMVWQLAWAMNIFHRLRGFQEDALTAIRAWADAAHRLADEPTLALARRYLGRVLANLGSHDEAMECLRQAMEAYQRNDDLLGQAYTQLVMGWSCGKRGDLASGLEYSENGLYLFRTVGHPVWTVDALCAVATYQARLGHPDSVTTIREAQELAETHDYREGQANSLQVLGIAHQMRGEFAAAERALAQAVQRFRELGNGFFEGTTLGYLGDTHNALGNLAKAKEFWQEAIDVMSAQGRLAEVTAIQEKLEELVSVEDSRIG